MEGSREKESGWEDERIPECLIESLTPLSLLLMQSVLYRHT